METAYVKDYTYHLPQDIIQVQTLQIYKRINSNNVYTFGYKFKETVSQEDKAKFILGLTDGSMSASDLRQFIELPFKGLDNRIGAFKSECMVYPAAARNTLRHKMICFANNFMPKGSPRCSFEYVLSAPKDSSKYARLQHKNILVIDISINQEVEEVLQVLGELNSNSDIYVYRLIGKEK